MTDTANTLGFTNARGLCCCGQAGCRALPRCPVLTACPSVGSLLPVAYTASSSFATLEIMDLLVTTPIARGVMLGFRFYPHADGYNSAAASAVAFSLDASLAAGDVVRLARNAVSGTDLILDPAGAATTIGHATTVPSITAISSCMVYWAPNLQTLRGISWIGLRDTAVAPVTEPIPPPTSVVPCQFAFFVDRYTAAQGYVFYDPSAYVPNIPGTWINAWQVLKFSAGWVAADAAVDAYAATVDAATDVLYVSLTPGQLTAVAYRPYDFAAAPAFAAQLVLVLTSCVPPGTVVYITGNDWGGTSVGVADAWFVWTSPPTTFLPPGTVVDITNLLPPPSASAPTASVGTMALGAGHAAVAPNTDITAFTAYSASVADSANHPVAAVYPCAYRGIIAAGLQPGMSILQTPWPDCSAILSFQTCKRICDWPCEQTVLNRTAPVRWLLQPTPSFVQCGPSCPVCCVQKNYLPSVVNPTVPIVTGCGCQPRR